MTNNKIKFDDSTVESENVNEIIKQIKNEIGSHWKI